MSEGTTYRLRLYVTRDGRNVQPEPYHEVVGKEALAAEVEQMFMQARAGSITVYIQKEWRDDMDLKYQVWKKLEEHTWMDPLAEKKRQLEGAIRWHADDERKLVEGKERIAQLEAEVARLEAGDDPSFVQRREYLKESRGRRYGQ